MTRFAGRRDRLASTLKKRDADAFLVSNPINVSYLTGFSGEDSYLLVSPRKSLLLSDSRFTEQIEEECPGLEFVLRRSGESLTDAIAKVVKRSRFRSILFESTAVTVSTWEIFREKVPSVEWTGWANDVERLRAIKDADEIQQIRQAITMAERSFALFRAAMRPGDDEKSLADAMESYVRRSGGTRSAFPPIVAVGSRAALPHAVPTNRRVEEGDFVLVDWGAKGKFYNSDLTRILVTRKISPKLARIYDVVLQAQLRAIAKIRPGVTGQEVDFEARSAIEEAGFGKYFGHGLGHGLGMQVHEAPAVRQRATNVLKAGMVVTVEPGIYLRGWGGIRVEDDVLVTKEGHEVLTSVPKRLEESIVA